MLNVETFTTWITFGDGVWMGIGWGWSRSVWEWVGVSEAVYEPWNLHRSLLGEAHFEMFIVLVNKLTYASTSLTTAVQYT